MAVSLIHLSWTLLRAEEDLSRVIVQGCSGDTDLSLSFPCVLRLAVFSYTGVSKYADKPLRNPCILQKQQEHGNGYMIEEERLHSSIKLVIFTQVVTGLGISSWRWSFKLSFFMLINRDAGTACNMWYNFAVGNHLLIRDSKIWVCCPFYNEEKTGGAQIGHTLKYVLADVETHFSETWPVPLLSKCLGCGQEESWSCWFKCNTWFWVQQHQHFVLDHFIWKFWSFVVWVVWVAPFMRNSATLKKKPKHNKKPNTPIPI